MHMRVSVRRGGLCVRGGEIAPAQLANAGMSTSWGVLDKGMLFNATSLTVLGGAQRAPAAPPRAGGLQLRLRL